MMIQVIPLYPEYFMPESAGGTKALPAGPEGYTLYHSQIVNTVEDGLVLFLVWYKP